MEEKAKETNHLTAKQAGEIASKSGSEKLVLVHISSRYSKEPKKILDDARSVFENTKIVNDFDTLEL